MKKTSAICGELSSFELLESSLQTRADLHLIGIKKALLKKKSRALKSF